MEIRQFANAYRNRRVLVTGHTGFKGSWLSLWLLSQGAAVTGVSLAPETSPNHWDLIKLDVSDHRLDIRDQEPLLRTIAEARPEIVFHLAAQPLVRRSYRDPLETWSTNVVGTANVLEACRRTPSVRAVVVVTTDKCYENRHWPWGYRENDRLGGHEPYSASKAAAELVAASYRAAYFDPAGAPLLATARAGNVIGGGDWAEDRLVPDAARAVASGKELEIRSPAATRPWQHVLEPLSGYLLLGQKLLQGERRFAEAWNFGPDSTGNRSVEHILSRLQEQWTGLRWRVTQQPQPHEAWLLHLDSTKARSLLGWQPVWSIDQGLRATAEWYHNYIEDNLIITESQLAAYVSAAADAGAAWLTPA